MRTVCLAQAGLHAQFRDEKIAILSERGGGLSGGGLNCFALLSRDNHVHSFRMDRCHFKTTRERITGSWVREELERFSQSICRQTVVVLDNARVHGAKVVQERMAAWQERGLFVLSLPPYSPQLNIAEILWRKLKYEWLRPEDYTNKDTLSLCGLASTRRGWKRTQDRLLAIQSRALWCHIIVGNYLLYRYSIIEAVVLSYF